MQFTSSIILNGVTISTLPFGPFREIGSWICSSRHRQRLEKVVSLVLPVIDQRLATRANNLEAAPQLDAMHWTLELT